MSSNKTRTLGEIVASGQVNEEEAEVFLKRYNSFIGKLTPLIEKSNDVLKPINDILSSDEALNFTRAILDALEDFNKQCNDAERQAKEILELSKTASISDFLKLDAIPPMTVLMLLGILNEDIKVKIESAKKAHFSALAKKGAPIRHAETNQLRKEVKEYWFRNIDYKLSNEKAADILKPIFILSHRKLKEIVSEAKKEIKNK